MKLKAFLGRETLDYISGKREAKPGEDISLLDAFKSALSPEKSIDSVREELRHYCDVQASRFESTQNDISGIAFFPLSICYFVRSEPGIGETFDKELCSKRQNLYDADLPIRRIKETNPLLGWYYSLLLPEYHNYLRGTRRG